MTPRTRLHLIRHGQVIGHDQPRYNGQTDVALTAAGIEQYHSLKNRLSGVSLAACYSSDLIRCTAGAEIICGDLGVETYRRSELRELNIGIWEGLTWQEIQKSWPDEWQARLADLVNYRVPQGENLLDVEARVIPVIDEIIERHRGEDVLVVAHGGVNRVILLKAIGAPLNRMFNIEQSYGCYNIIDYYTDGQVTVKLLNG
ncbi:MAG: alpha-ribazole phosphatase [Desulfuromonadales bacterium]